MKIAFDKEFVYIKPGGGVEFDRDNLIITGLPMSVYDRSSGAWKCPICAEVLDMLDDYIRLPPKLQDIHAKLRRRGELIEAARTSEAPTGEFPVKAKLYSHQIRGANMALAAFGAGGGFAPEHSGFALLFEMGCGKTLTAIAVIGRLFREGRLHKVLILAPSSVVPVWPREFERFADYPAEVCAIQGTALKRVDTLRQLKSCDTDGVKAAVINYEAVWREDPDRDKSVFDAVRKFDPDMIICDESQRIKSPAAKQSKAVHRLGDSARYKLILSGTPQSNSPMDFWSQYRFMDSTVFGTNYYHFRDRYAVMGGFGGKKVVAVRDLNDLMRRVHSLACRVTKAEALDLPEQVFMTRLCDMSSREKNIYRKVKNDCYAELAEYNGEITADMITTRMIRLQQITGGFCQLDGEYKPRTIGRGKLDALKELIEDYAGKKIVVFARFRPEIDAIKRMLDRMKVGYAAVDGSVPLAARGGLVDRFQTDPECMVFVAQIDTAGLGLTLTAADTAIYYSCNFNYEAYDQSLSRIHRIGQRNSCTYIRLICPGTIDEDIYRALESKKNFAQVVVDGWRVILK